MPKSSKGGFYAVHVGQRPGVYLSWEDCEKEIKGYPKAKFKKFRTEAEALAFVKYGASVTGEVALAASLKSSSRKSRRTPVQATTSAKLKKERLQVADVADESTWDVVYTDGACQGNGQVNSIAGIGVWWGDNDSRNLSERCPGDQTNNRAELIAIIRALETVHPTCQRLLIKTDSTYSIQCIRDWIPNWRTRGWKTSNGKDVKNRPVITYLSHLLDEQGRKACTVQLQYVKGHAGVPGNEGADYLAGLGALKPAVPERDWAIPREDGVTEVGEDAQLKLEISDKYLLPDQIQQMAESGEFD